MHNHSIRKAHALKLYPNTLRTLASPALTATWAPMITTNCSVVGHSTCALGCTGSAAG